LFVFEAALPFGVAPFAGLEFAPAFGVPFDVGFAPFEVFALAVPLLRLAFAMTLLPPSPPFAPDPVAGGDGCGGVGAGGGALASSSMPKGCESICWLVADACNRCDDASESVALTSDVILGALGTVALRKAT
jgi:hypothetical protein